MNITRYNPIYPASGFRNLVDEFFNRNIAENFGSDFLSNTPSINVIETESDYKIEVAAPGLDKGDFEVNVDMGYLSVSAKKERSDEVKDGKYTRREFNYSTFNRSFQLPEHVQADNIAATYANGVLIITLPKHKEAKANAGRVIEIK